MSTNGQNRSSTQRLSNEPFICPGAPSPTRVRLYVAEKNAAELVVQVTQVVVNLRAGEQRREAHLARNPLGRVPVLEVERGVFLGESLAIIEYLEECFPEPSMLGSTPLERAQVRELDRIAELRVLLPLGRLVHSTNSPMARRPNRHWQNTTKACCPLDWASSTTGCAMDVASSLVTAQQSLTARSPRRWTSGAVRGFRLTKSSAR